MIASDNQGSLFRCAKMRCTLWTAVLVAGLITAATASATTLTAMDIVPIPANLVGSGNGTLDFILFTSSTGGASNASGGFNGDDANTQLPTGNSKTTANESFITSIGELRDYYTLNFPNGQGGSTVSEIVLFVDVNETGMPQEISLDALTINLNVNAFSPASDPRNDPAGNDISFNDQNKTDANFSGGTLLASLPSSAILELVNQGGGFADQAIFTGINPFDAGFSDNDQILIHWESSVHDNGGETVFLSGDFAPQDLPEPATLALGFAGLLCLATGRSNRA